MLANLKFQFKNMIYHQLCRLMINEKSYEIIIRLTFHDLKGRKSKKKNFIYQSHHTISILIN